MGTRERVGEMHRRRARNNSNITGTETVLRAFHRAGCAHRGRAHREETIAGAAARAWQRDRNGDGFGQDSTRTIAAGDHGQEACTSKERRRRSGCEVELATGCREEQGGGRAAGVGGGRGLARGEAWRGELGRPATGQRRETRTRKEVGRCGVLEVRLGEATGRWPWPGSSRRCKVEVGEGKKGAAAGAGERSLGPAGEGARRCQG